MKIRLPNSNEHHLDERLSLEEKKAIVQVLTEEYMTVILENWDSNAIRFFLDSLANYLVWHKEEEESGHDKEVMSRNKTNRMIRGRRDIPFSDLSNEQQELLGLDGAEQ